MKIVLIDKEEGQKVGGISIFNQRLYDHLTLTDHEVFILRFAKKRQRQKNVYRIPYYLAEQRTFIVLPTEKALQIIRQHLTEIKPDIVYTCIGLSPLDFLLPWLCHDLRIPLAGIWHADFNYSANTYQLLVKSVFLAYQPFCRQLDLLHVFSQKLANFYINHGIDKQKICILPNGIDPNIFNPGESLFKKRNKIKTGVLFVGRITLQKNPEELITAFLSLAPPKDTKLVIVGFGDLEEILREKYPDPRIIFTGVVTDQEKKLDILRGCQIFALPSRFEGMPLALLEAMATGLACITSDAGTNSELVNGAGVVIPVAKLRQDLPFALKLCLEYPEFTNILGKKARERVISSYSQEKIFNQLISAWEGAIRDYRERGSPTTKPLNLDLKIEQRLRMVWAKARQIVSYFEI